MSSYARSCHPDNGTAAVTGSPRLFLLRGESRGRLRSERNRARVSPFRASRTRNGGEIRFRAIPASLSIGRENGADFRSFALRRSLRSALSSPATTPNLTYEARSVNP